MKPIKDRGFTLIELLVVISVIGILAGILLPAISLVRDSARKANCGSNQRQIVLAMVLYSTEYRLWPSSTLVAAPTDVADAGAVSQGVMRKRLQEDYKVFVCPSAVRPDEMKRDLQSTDYESWTDSMTSYAYDYQIPITAKPGRVVMADRKNAASQTVHKKTAIASFVDGHVGNLNLASGVYGNPDADDADIYVGTTATTDNDTDANVR